MPTQSDVTSAHKDINPAHSLSQVLGACYVTAWSFSFYPQLINNYLRKAIDGLSLSFVLFNMIGFSFYLIYTLCFYFSTSVQDQYKDRNHGLSNLVATQDVVFAVHAWILTVVAACQALYYKTHNHTVSNSAKLILLLILGSTVIMLGYTLKAVLIGSGVLELIYFLGAWKLILSFVKYMPQMIMNYRLKSTHGWSIYNILLDASGGFLSLAQLLVDGWILTHAPGFHVPRSHHWLSVSIKGNFAKFGLAILSLLFDSVFITQHYFLYPQSRLPVDSQQLSTSEPDESTSDEHVRLLQDI